MELPSDNCFIRISGAQGPSGTDPGAKKGRPQDAGTPSRFSAPVGNQPATASGLSAPLPHGLQGLHGLQGFFAAQGLHGLQAAAQGLQEPLPHGLHGLQGLQGFFAAQGLHGLHAAEQGLQEPLPQGLHGLQGFFAAHGLHGLQDPPPWASAVGLAGAAATASVSSTSLWLAWAFSAKPAPVISTIVVVSRLVLKLIDSVPEVDLDRSVGTGPSPRRRPAHGSAQWGEQKNAASRSADPIQSVPRNATRTESTPLTLV
ncbi:MAG: hypothetical protein R8L07_05870 [Alphaproteobacteria bacterium]|nr:hypothetical protein [Alphaproteobacteria bacterium]